jgi:ubiquinone/menaquinone biosynthesis C-methylase UbiE
MTETIYQRPRDYDLEHEGDEQNIGALGEMVRAHHPMRVLELGAGSGRLAIPLARLGGRDSFDVVGLELADEMRAGAQEKLAENRQVFGVDSPCNPATCEAGSRQIRST